MYEFETSLLFQSSLMYYHLYMYKIYIREHVLWVEEMENILNQFTTLGGDEKTLMKQQVYKCFDKW